MIKCMKTNHPPCRVLSHVLLFECKNSEMNQPARLARALPFSERLRTALVDRACERRLHSRYHFDGWPALVLLRDGEYVGSINRMQDWDVYLSEIERLLHTAPSRLPGFKIPVVGDSSHHCH